MAGREVAQAYVRWDGGDDTQPRWHLCALGSVFLLPGEKKQVRLCIGNDDLYTYHADGSRAVEKGSYTLWVGGGQPDQRTSALLGREPLKTSFTL
jgi:beta-glucosidase